MTHFLWAPLAACLPAHHSHLSLDLPHPNTLARHLPLRGRPLGSWPRGLGQKYNLPRSALRVLQSPGDRRTRQARGPHGIQGTRRRTPGHLSSTFQSYPTNSVTQAVRVSTCHWSELPPTALPYTSFPQAQSMSQAVGQTQCSLSQPQQSSCNFPETSWAEHKGWPRGPSLDGSSVSAPPTHQRQRGPCISMAT